MKNLFVIHIGIVRAKKGSRRCENGSKACKTPKTKGMHGYRVSISTRSDKIPASYYVKVAMY